MCNFSMDEIYEKEKKKNKLECIIVQEHTPKYQM